MGWKNRGTPTAVFACICLGCGTQGLQEATADTGQTSGGGSTTTAPSETSGGNTAVASAEDGSESGDPHASTGGQETDDTGNAATSSATTSGPTDLPPVASPFYAGFDTADISPDNGDLAQNIYLGGYGAPYLRGPAQGVHDAIFIRSMALELGGEGFVLAVADLPGMGNEFTGEIRARVAQQIDIDPSRVLIGTTHTHAGPDFQGLWGGGPSAYRNRVVDVIVGSMNTAWVSRAAAELEVATADGPNSNRRDWEYTDDSLTVLLARDPRGAVLGTLGVFAAHPTVLGESNKLISRDWCGSFVDTLEAEYGSPSVLFNGALGDASSATPAGNYADDFERADAYGSTLAAIAVTALGASTPIEHSLYVDHRSWTIPVNNALFQIAAALDILDYDFASTDDGQEVTTSSTYIRLGHQLQMVTFPGESLTRNALDIKDTMTAPHQMVLGQTGDSLGYFIPSDEWMTGRNGDYEETVSLHEVAGDLTRDTLVELIQSDDF